MKAKSASSKSTDDSPWSHLTWEYVRDWADPDAFQRGQKVQREGRVHGFQLEPDGQLFGVVRGHEDYEVQLWFESFDSDDGQILCSDCTCPVQMDGCKHAVALVLEFLSQRGTNPPEPQADVPEKKINWKARVKAHIEGMSQEALAELVLHYFDKVPELYEECRLVVELATSSVEDLIASVRQEIKRVTSIRPRRGFFYDGNEEIPDYGPLIEYLKRLIALGQADAVADLAGEILLRGMAQVHAIHGSREVVPQFVECMKVVAGAIKASKMTLREQLVFGVNALVSDSSNVLSAVTGPILRRQYSQEDWSHVADVLLQRMGEGLPRDQALREGFIAATTSALKNAGRVDESAKIHEADARASGQYERVVRWYLDQNRQADAYRMAREDIEAVIANRPGYESYQLQSYRQMAKTRQQHDIVAAHAAFEFLHAPRIETYNVLLKAAAKAKCADAVLSAVQHYLETGEPFLEIVAKKKGEELVRGVDGWPLPVPAYLEPAILEMFRRRQDIRSPKLALTVSIAIAEKRLEDALHWFDRMTVGGKVNTYPNYYMLESLGDQLAAAVTATYPDRALGIYRRHLELQLTQANQNAYESAARQLGKMRPIMMALGDQTEWPALVQHLRMRFKNRPKFVAILDRMQKKAK